MALKVPIIDDGQPDVSFETKGLTDVGYIELGTTFAGTGNIRLPNGGTINARNNADSADLAVFLVNTSDQLSILGGAMLVSGTTLVSVGATSLVTNLNADQLDSQEGSYYRNASNINAGTLSIAYFPSGGTWTTNSNLIVEDGGSNTLFQITNATGAAFSVGICLRMALL